MSGYNKTILIGNLTKDPELKYTQNGTAVAKIGLAVNRTWRGKDGQKQEECTFIDVDAFGKQAETVAKYCTKGMPLMVEGRLKLDQWEDKNTGKHRQKLGVVLEGFTFIGGGQGGSDRNQAGQSRPGNVQANDDAEADRESPIDDEDVPF